jgi:hypothetical protein
MVTLAYGGRRMLKQWAMKTMMANTTGHGGYMGTARPPDSEWREKGREDGREREEREGTSAEAQKSRGAEVQRCRGAQVHKRAAGSCRSRRVTLIRGLGRLPLRCAHAWPWCVQTIKKNG